LDIKIRVIFVKFSKQILTIEQNIPIKERLEQQKKYANVLNDGEKVFIVRWKQTVLVDTFLFLIKLYKEFFFKDKERDEFKKMVFDFEALIDKDEDKLNHENFLREV
jgi:hypothetical protein